MNPEKINPQTYTFQVGGMHCQACVFLLQEEIGSCPEVDSVSIDLADRSIKVIGDFGSKNTDEVAAYLTELVKDKGYSLSTKRNKKVVAWHEFKVAVPVAFLFLLGFVFLQKIGLVDMIGGSGDGVSLGTVFFIGIVASLSTCMAVVGGLVLSLSASLAKEKSNLKPHLLFHTSRLVTFFLLGGVLGLIGEAFIISNGVAFGLGIIVGLVMLVLGVNLLDITTVTGKLQLSLPNFISQRAKRATLLNHTLAPLLIGLATFFLPCGFTQSMQLYALSTGDFMSGALTMLAFALGTLPVLALMSFGAFGIQQSQKRGVFFKTAGLVVIMFALFNIVNSLVAFGIIKPIFSL